MKKTSRRNQTNPKQIHLLILLYKFRFVTSKLLADYKQVRVSSINKSLEILTELKLIGRKYEEDYRIERKGAIYYLLPKAFPVFKDKLETNEAILHSMYKNNTVGAPFIDGYLDIFKAYVRLRNSYPDTFHIFTKSDLGDYDYFVEDKSDLYLNRKKHIKGTHNEFVIEVPNDLLYLIKKRFDLYLEHFDSGDWEAETDSPYPAVAFVCQTSKIEQGLQIYAAKALENSGIEDLKVITTSKKALLDEKSNQTKIWSAVDKPGELLALDDISVNP